MIVMGLTIPQPALDAGNAVMTGDFNSEDVRGAIARSLYDLYHQDVNHSVFDYGAVDKIQLQDRIGDRLMQKARQNGKIQHLGGGRWRALPKIGA